MHKRIGRRISIAQRKYFSHRIKLVSVRFFFFLNSKSPNTEHNPFVYLSFLPDSRTPNSTRYTRLHGYTHSVLSNNPFRNSKKKKKNIFYCWSGFQSCYRWICFCLYFIFGHDWIELDWSGAEHTYRYIWVFISLSNRFTSIELIFDITMHINKHQFIYFGRCALLVYSVFYFFFLLGA